MLHSCWAEVKGESVEWRTPAHSAPPRLQNVDKYLSSASLVDINLTFTAVYTSGWFYVCETEL